MDPRTELWALHPTHLEALLSGPPRELQARGHSAGGVDSEPPFSIHNGIAVLRVDGIMSKYGFIDGGGAATATIAGALMDLAERRSVQGIMMVFDTPGGSVAGTEALAFAVEEAARKKPVHGHVEDLCASAGLWVASQCHTLTAEPAAEVGSIGTVTYTVDSSEAHERAGIKVHTISSGGVKGGGEAGTPVTDEHLSELQRRVDAFQQHFVQGVARGRKLPHTRVRELADGRLHIASDARSLGLIDGVERRQLANARMLSAAGKHRSHQARAAVRTMRIDQLEASINNPRSVYDDDDDSELWL